MSKGSYYQSDGEKPSIGVGWLFSILVVTSLGLWWAIIYMAISWLWK